MMLKTNSPLPKMRSLRARLLGGFVAMFISMTCWCSTGQAQLSEGSTSFNAIAEQLITIVADPPPGFETFANAPLPLSATGTVSFNWDADADMDNTVDVLGFNASFQGVAPGGLGAFTLESGGPGGEAPFGTLSDIMATDSGDLISAQFTINTPFAFLFDSGLTIYTKDSPAFSGAITGQAGDLFISDGPVDGFLRLGGSTDDDPVLGVSTGRTVTAIPEPGSLMFLAGLGLIGCVTRRKS